MVWDQNEYAFSTWTLNRLSTIPALTLIRDNGFQSVEIWADNAHLDPALAPDVQEAAHFLSENKMRTHSIHAPFGIHYPDMTDEKGYRAYRMQVWRKTIDTCEQLECNKMVIHALNDRYRYRPDQSDIVKECLMGLCDYGKQHGVMIALENIAYGLKPDELLCTLQNQISLFSGFGLKYCLDIGHVALNGAQMYPEIDCAIHDLVSFHISNNDGIHDLHDTPDKGVLHWPEIYSYIRAAGYKGKFVLEINGGKDQQATLERTASLFH